MKVLFSFFLFAFSLSFCGAQLIIDDFESGTLDAWEVLSGNAEAQSNSVQSGNFAGRLHAQSDAGRNGQTILLHKTFDENWGTYSMHVRADGSDSDIQFIFQYMNVDNFYQVNYNPASTDNPEFVLAKMKDGNYQVLDSVAPEIGLNSWFELRIDRTCDGGISVFVNDELKLMAIDQDLKNTGKVAISSWGESTYFDSIAFEINESIADTTIFVDLCQGSIFRIDSFEFATSGMYRVKVESSAGCDSIFNIDLTVRKNYLSSRRDTICAGGFAILGIDTFRTAGTHHVNFTSSYGCDSLLELSLTVIGEDAGLQLDTVICPGETLAIRGISINAPGTYYDTIDSGYGCLAITEINVMELNNQVDLGPDQTFCFDDTPVISLAPGISRPLRWSDGSTGPAIQIMEPGIYWLDVGSGSCVVRDSVEILESCPSESEVFIPNAFTPNGDLRNDNFAPEYAAGNIGEMRIQIFDRWGGSVFSGEGVEGWDGRIDGDDGPEGVYLYLIVIDGKQYTGSVSLIR